MEVIIDAYENYSNMGREDFVQQAKYMVAYVLIKEDAQYFGKKEPLMISEVQELAELCVDISNVLGSKAPLRGIATYLMFEFLEFDYPEDYEVMYFKIDKFRESKNLQEWVDDYVVWQNDQDEWYR